MVNEQTFTFPFKAKDWGSKFLIGSLLLLISYIIPIIPMIFVLGYVIRGMEFTIRTGEKRLMEWDNWTDLGLKGILYVLVYFIYLLPGLVLFAGGMTSAGISIILHSSGDGAVVLPLFILGKLFLISAIVLLILAVLLLIIGALMAPIGIARLAATGELARALEIDRVWSIIYAQLGDFLLVWALNIGLGYVASMIYGILYYTVCCCILIPILAAPISLYIMIFGMALFVQVYRQGESVTSDAPLLLPDKTSTEERPLGDDESVSNELGQREATSEPKKKFKEMQDELKLSQSPVSSYELPLSDLDLPTRAERILLENGFVTIGQILQALEKTEEELLAIKGFGAKSLDELKVKLRAKGFLE